MTDDVITDPCRCNQPDSARDRAHQRGDEAFCRDAGQSTPTLADSASAMLELQAEAGKYAAERDEARAEVERLRHEREKATRVRLMAFERIDEARVEGGKATAEVERMRPVVEAAVRLAATYEGTKIAQTFPEGMRLGDLRVAVASYREALSAPVEAPHPAHVHAGALALALHDADCGCGDYDEGEDSRYITAARTVLDAGDVTPRHTVLAAESVVMNMLMNADEHADVGDLARSIVTEVRTVLPQPVDLSAPVEAGAIEPDREGAVSVTWDQVVAGVIVGVGGEHGPFVSQEQAERAADLIMRSARRGLAEVGATELAPDRVPAAALIGRAFRAAREAAFAQQDNPKRNLVASGFSDIASKAENLPEREVEWAAALAVLRCALAEAGVPAEPTGDTEPLTFEQFEVLVRRAHAAHPGWRLGQTYVNVAHTFLADLLEPIEAAHADCFYRDDMIPGFRAALLDALSGSVPSPPAPTKEARDV